MTGQTAIEIPLRDIHTTAAPSLWPPAPGWWWLAAVILMLLLTGLWYWRRKRARRRAMEQLFARTLAQAANPAERVNAILALLRRAARRHHANADRLDGEAWLRALDEGLGEPGFREAGLAPLLSHGRWQRQLDEALLERFETLARRRFLLWMDGRP